MDENKEEKTNVTPISKKKSVWAIFKDFVKEAIIKTPFETIFELALLVAGGTRTLDFMGKMGQSGFIAAIALIYSEIGLIFMEFLEYRGKRVQYEYVNWRGKRVKGYPLINQKSLAKFGLWCVHIPMTVFFTASDIIKTNFETLAQNNSISFDGSFDTGFAWAFGVVIALGFLADLIIIINYKSSDPERRHQEEMNQLAHDRAQLELEKEKITAEEELNYERENGEKLIRTKVKLNKRREFIKEFEGDLGKDYLESELDEIDLSVKNKNQKVEENSGSIPANSNKKRKYVHSGQYKKEKQDSFSQGENLTLLERARKLENQTEEN